MIGHPARRAAQCASILLALACASGELSAQSQQPATWPPPGVSFYGDPAAPDISGLWQGSMIGIPGVEPAPNRGSADGAPLTYWAPWPLPYAAEYQKIVSEMAGAFAQGRQLRDTTASCLPLGMPRAVDSRVYPDEIVQTPGEVAFFLNSATPIIVWTDGRTHPKNLKPSFNGHSIGHWSGDTLFVDTVGINALTALDTMRNPHSDKLHIKWAVRLVAKDRLHMQLTLMDDDAFTEPVVVTNIYRRKTDPRWQLLDDGSCFENNRTTVDEHGTADGFVKF